MPTDLILQFERRFGRVPELGARAPGRVNLIGEHTDYNEGLVLPCAIDRDTTVLAARRDDGRVRVYSQQRGELAEFELERIARGRGWVDYVQGVFFALRETGVRPAGLDLLVSSQLPQGSGLSSSAALEVAVTTAVDLAQGLGLDARARARIAHRAESGFVGVACGLMDQLASALGRRDHALRIDCRSLDVLPVRLPPSLRLLIADSGVRRRLADGAYNRRRQECEEAFAQLRAAHAAPRGATALRDLCPDDLGALERCLDATLFRRARHVITENQRVERTCAAFAWGDLAAAGARLREGMASLQRDFEVSTPELDALCEIADAQPGSYGSRLTGAGFGGCTVHLVAADAAEQVAQAIVQRFEARFGRRPPVLEAQACDGAGALAL